MSSYAIIQDTTLELRRRIHASLASAPDADFGLTTPEADITLSPPGDDLTGTPRLSLFLYHLQPSAHLRNQRPLAVGPDGLRHPHLPLELHYLITPLDDEEDQNQLMLGRIIQHFHDEPAIVSLNGALLDDSFGGSSPALRVTLDAKTMEELAQVWQALETGFRLSLCYTVRLAAVDSGLGETEARRVQTAQAAVGLKE